MANNNIKKLTDYQHIRLRTEMYLGSRSPHTQTVINIDNDGNPVPEEMTWVPALYTAFREGIDNALDEVVGHRHGHRIDITYNPETLEFSVEDNGRGIPIDYDEVEKMHKATMVVSHTRAGRNFEDRGNIAGTNGIGISAVNFCSEYFILTIHTDGQKFVQKFTEGNVVVDELNIHKPDIRKISSGKTGTKVEWKLSKTVFEHHDLPEQFIKSRVTEIALTNPNVRFYYNGEPIKANKKLEKVLFTEYEPIILEIKKPKFTSYFYLVPNFSDNEMIHTIVNNIPAFNGGVHIDTFKTEFFRGIVNSLEREGKRRKVTPNRTDVSDGLLIYNVTVMEAPDFDSQSKTRLINEWVGKEIKDFFKNDTIFKNILKKNKDWIEMIFERAAIRTNKKDLQETRKLANAAKKSKVEKLRDATGTDRSKCILFLTEGDSAVSEMSSARTPEIHGGLPLKGKVLNVNGESPKKILDTQALVDIMNSLGLILGERANRHKMRYGKLFIATDMDPDGSNIAALLVNFLYTFWPELFDPDAKEPFVYFFMTPFIIASKGPKGKTRKYWYGHNYNEFDTSTYNKRNGWEVTRAKGLATLTEDDWVHSLAKPELLPITDDGDLKESLDLLFNGKRADDRKDWIAL